MRFENYNSSRMRQWDRTIEAADELGKSLRRLRILIDENPELRRRVYENLKAAEEKRSKRRRLPSVPRGIRR